MDQVLQEGRRKQKRWSANDQVIAEVAAACGVTYVQISEILQCSKSAVRCHLRPLAAESHRNTCRRYRENNLCKVKASAQKFSSTHPNARKEYYELHKDKRLKAMRDYYAANSEKISQWRKDNISKRRQSFRDWAAANPGKIKEYRRRRWMSAKGRDACRRRNSIRRAARRCALIPTTLAAIDARFALWRNRCAFCGVDASHARNRGHERLSVEHVLALTNDGLDDASNIAPACLTCNSSKWNRPVESWYRRQPFFTEARWRKIQHRCPAAVVGQLPLAFPG
jgi:hypothetical protein